MKARISLTAVMSHTSLWGGTWKKMAEGRGEVGGLEQIEEQGREEG